MYTENIDFRVMSNIYSKKNNIYLSTNQSKAYIIISIIKFPTKFSVNPFFRGR